MKKPRFPRAINFGFGFKVPIIWKKRVKNTDGKVLSAAYTPATVGTPLIELDSTEPLWEQYDLLGHEVIHAAIDFHRHLMTEAMEIRAEAAKEEERERE